MSRSTLHPEWFAVFPGIRCITRQPQWFRPYQLLKADAVSTMFPPTLDPIPDWDSNGLLPPIDEESPTSRSRAPYPASLLDIVERFGNTRARRRLLMGLLDFRSELHSAGLVQGFQWIDGSFTENVEDREDRDPCDIDLVTFFHPPNKSHPLIHVLDRKRVKHDHKVDHYPVPLYGRRPQVIVEDIVYWYTVFAHRKEDFQWKGYMQVDLADSDDAHARYEVELLEKIESRAGQR